ncbi:MAG: DUF2029 domain-containing protein [Parvularculaceae bacterium]|nr:DUF2029 domain-containing protein [Parvularculaceae bacterium]
METGTAIASLSKAAGGGLPASRQPASSGSTTGPEVTAAGPWFMALIIVSALASCLVAILFSDHVFAFPARVVDAPPEDLVVFHSISDFLERHSLAAAYDPDIFRNYLPEGRQAFLWLNPPHAVFFFSPLGALPYGVAKAILYAISALAMFGVCRLSGVKDNAIIAAAVLSPGMLAFAFTTQLGPILALLIIVALTQSKTRPILAGLAIAVATIKPQYGLLVPVFLIATGAWRAFAVAAITSSLLALASVVCFGFDSWIAFVQSTGLSPTGPGGSPQLFSATIGQLFAKIGAPAGIAIAAQLVAIGVAARLIWAAAKTLPLERAAGLAMILSLVAAPSAWTYDWAFVMAAILMLAKGQHWPLRLQLIAGAAWMAPLAVFLSSPAATPNLALIALAAALTWREFGGFRPSAHTTRTTFSASG